jgi:hypothetical protein
MMRIVILIMGILMSSMALATDNDLSYGGGFFNYNGKGSRFDRIWLGNTQVQKQAACTDGVNVYAYVTQCVRPEPYGGSIENEPRCEVGGYAQVLISAPVQYEKWVCLRERNTGNRENYDCEQWGKSSAQLDISGVPACAQQNQQQQQRQQQQRQQQQQQRQQQQR